MPILLPQDLPASDILKNEQIFVMDRERAGMQDIRPLEVIIVNLMPTKIQTETQLLRRVSNIALQVNLELLRTDSYVGKNTSFEHLKRFYTVFEEIRHKKYDAMIVTGAPVEKFDFEEVKYWDELRRILDFARTNVFSTMFICWAAQAAWFHYYGIQKYEYEKKLFGVFEVSVEKRNALTSGFDDTFFVPHSRYTYCKRDDIEKISDIQVLAASESVGVHMAATKDNRLLFITGHGEYDTKTLDDEYRRDKEKGIDIEIPTNYYRDDNPEKGVFVRWKAHSNLLFANWLNYCVYQETPFNVQNIKEKIL